MKARLAAVRAYKKGGGKIYTIGSTAELQQLADLISPTELFTTLKEKSGRKILLNNIGQLTGDQIISIQGSPHVVANVVHKRGTDHYIIHVVNYDQPVKNIQIKINLDGFVENLAGEVQLFTPDAVSAIPVNVQTSENSISFILPELDIYNVVVIK